MTTNPKIKEPPNMLECHALRYWEISTSWNSATHKKSTITVSDALHKLRHIICNTNPTRPIAVAAQELLQDIIHNAKG